MSANNDPIDKALDDFMASLIPDSYRDLLTKEVEDWAKVGCPRAKEELKKRNLPLWKLLNES